MGQSRPLFVYFRPFRVTIPIQIEKEQMVCLGFKPGTAGWQAQTKPRCYGGHPVSNLLSLYLEMTDVGIIVASERPFYYSKSYLGTLLRRAIVCCENWKSYTFRATQPHSDFGAKYISKNQYNLAGFKTLDKTKRALYYVGNAPLRPLETCFYNYLTNCPFFNKSTYLQCLNR